MMYVEQYAQQRINEQQAERESDWRRVAEHWHEDARTIHASKWAVVRLFDWIMDRRAARSLTRLPDGARPHEVTADTHDLPAGNSETATEWAADVSAGHAAEREPLWTADSIVGRFAEHSEDVNRATDHVDVPAEKDLAPTR